MTVGYERVIFYGVAGAEAGTQIVHAIDIDLDKEPERADTTDRGDSSVVPHHTEQVVQLNANITFGYKDQGAVDADLTALLAAANAGTPLALLIRDKPAGIVEFDGDVSLGLTSPGPLAGPRDLEFTAVPTQESGRTWSS